MYPLNQITFDPFGNDSGVVALTIVGSPGTITFFRHATTGHFEVETRSGSPSYWLSTDRETSQLIADFLSGDIDTDVKPPRWTDGDVVLETTPSAEKIWVRALGIWFAANHRHHEGSDTTISNAVDREWAAGYSYTVLRQQNA